jgi:hypothetical protein
MGNIGSIPTPPMGSFETPSVFTFGSENGYTYEVRATLYPDGNMYLIQWRMNNGIKESMDETNQIKTIAVLEDGLEVTDMNGIVYTYKRLSTNDIVFINMKKTSFFTKKHSKLFTLSGNEEFDKFKVLFN